MKNCYFQIVIVFLLLSFLLFSYSKGFCYLEELDSAHIGQAGADNPFFSVILSGGVTDSNWLKIDDNLYLTPTKRIYYYNNTQGILSRITDNSIQIGEKTYGPKGDLLRYYHRAKDHLGKILYIDDYLGYIYDNKHKIIGYTLIKRDNNGNIIVFYEYKGFTYLLNGKVSGYYYIKRDARENFIIKYVYSKRKHFKNGKLKSYERKDVNKLNAVLSHYAYHNNEAGQLLNYTCKTYAKGRVANIYEYSNRAYGANRALVSYEWNKKNKDGKIIASGQWKKRSRNEKEL